jgi:hypothetical protein
MRTAGVHQTTCSPLVDRKSHGLGNTLITVTVTVTRRELAGWVPLLAAATGTHHEYMTRSVGDSPLHSVQFYYKSCQMAGLNPTQLVRSSFSQVTQVSAPDPDSAVVGN